MARCLSHTEPEAIVLFRGPVPLDADRLAAKTAKHPVGRHRAQRPAVDAVVPRPARATGTWAPPRRWPRTNVSTRTPIRKRSFYYVNGGQLWARCGSKARRPVQGLIGSVMPLSCCPPGVFTSQRCDTRPFVPVGFHSAPPSAQPQLLPALSGWRPYPPDGKYVAVVASSSGDVYFGTVGLLSYRRRS